MTERSPHHAAEPHQPAGDPSPIFVTGVPRSGTTLVSMVLGSHSRLAIAPETHYFDTFRRKGERRRCLASDERFRRFLRFFLSSREVEAFGFSSDEREAIFDEVAGGPERSHRVVLDAVLRRYARRQGKPLYGEKTPKHMHHIESLLGMFPRSRVVHVVRDPRDVVLSLREVGWEPGNVLRHLRHWQRSAEYVERYSREAADRFTAVRFEDLLDAPEDTVSGLCGFLGIGFEARMLDHHAHGAPNFDVRAEPWKANALGRIDPGLSGRWRSSLAPADRAVVERRLGPAMERLGYALSGSSRDPGIGARLAYLHIENAVLMGRHLLRRARSRLRASY